MTIPGKAIVTDLLSDRRVQFAMPPVGGAVVFALLLVLDDLIPPGVRALVLLATMVVGLGFYGFIAWRWRQEDARLAEIRIQTERDALRRMMRSAGAPRRARTEIDVAYERLGLPSDASLEQVEKAWKRIARLNHPDATRGDKASEEIFKEAGHAYRMIRGRR